jgi:hypothetical protein
MNLENIFQMATNYKTILKPDKDEPDWWAGAPSIAINDQKEFFLAARMREADSPRGRRGYEIRIMKSKNGENFTIIKQINRNDAKIPGFERPALLFDPKIKKYKLYGCSPLDSGWSIWKLDDVNDPVQFDPSTLHVVLSVAKSEKDQIETPDGGHHNLVSLAGYKDPFVIQIGNTWFMSVIGFDRIERPYLFKSSDGENWKIFCKEPILPSIGWHTFFTRPACILPLTIGYLLIYEGSHHTWFDPVYNIATGIAYSPDLRHFYDLTPDKPLLESDTPSQYRTWRYSHWITYDNFVYIYFEAANPNSTNEIRLSRIKL